MKILRLYLRVPPLKGGMEKHIEYLTKWQLANSNKVRLCFNCGDSIGEKSIQILPKVKLYATRPQALGIFIFYLIAMVRIFFAREKYDVIHIHGDWSSLVFGKLLKKITSSKLLIFSLHDELMPIFAHKKLLPKLLNNAGLIFSTGYSAVSHLQQACNTPLIFQPSGINSIFFETYNKNFNQKKFTIAIVANLFKKKNIELVLEIAMELKSCKFSIVGEGPHGGYLKNIKEVKKINNVEFVGFKQPQEIKQLYRISDCYLLTSLSEGTPTSMLEAIACGLPIITSNAGGVSNLIKDYVNGFVITDFDKKKYVNAIEKLLVDVDLRKEVFNNNLLLAKSYSWENVAKNITDLTRRGLNEKN
jgi:glycosyltransferase involved in cell wall biosynthesis